MPLALLIDDDPSNLVMLEDFLELQGYSTITTTSGIEGFFIAKARQPDIILTDVLMPDDTWDGITTIHHLKSHILTKHIPIVALTAIDSIRSKEQLGCDQLFHRPFQMKQLLTAFDEVIPAY